MSLSSSAKIGALSTEFTRQVGIEIPIIGGAMYPCSNPELVGAVSAAGAIGIVQPVSLVFVHKREFRAGLRYIKQLANNKPIGVNMLVEKSSQIYLERNKKWLEESLEEGVKFFITALGDPRWVVDIAKKKGAIVYHDITNLKWAEKALAGGVDGFICVNNRAGGHAGELTPEQLHKDIAALGKPLICAGGIGDEKAFLQALNMGYAGVQMGTRFIASEECTAHQDYKDAILKAKAHDIVLTEKITGIPVAVINTSHIKKLGIKPGRIANFLLNHQSSKHYMRMFYSLRSIWQLRQSLRKGSQYKDFFQAGKSVQTIDKIESAGAIIQRFAAAASSASS